MKRLSISFSVVILVLLILLGSGGFTISKMICGGAECAPTYALGKAKDCCISENSSEEAMSESCCCQLIDVSYALDEFSVSEKVNVHAQESILLYSPFVFLLHLPSSPVHFSLSDLSPPEAKELLYFFCTLLL